MADDDGYKMIPADQALFDAAGIVSTPEARQAAREQFRERLAAAEARMARPGAWDELRAKLRAPQPERAVAPTTDLLAAIGAVSTPETRQAARDLLDRAAARMTPEKWEALRAQHGLTRRAPERDER